MDENIKLISCNNEDALSSGSAMFKIDKLKKKISELFSKHRLGKELTQLFQNENLNIDVPSRQEYRQSREIFYQKWFDEGIPCEILNLRSEGWKKGKVKINLEVSIEFIPDEPEIKEPESPLDDLRRQINDLSS